MTAVRYTGTRLFMQTVLARAYVRVVGIERELPSVLFEMIFSGVSVITFVLIYRALHAPAELIGFVVVGGAMTPFWLNVLWSMASQLYWEKEQGNLAMYIIAPAPMMAVLLGMALGGMASMTVRAAMLIALGVLLFDVHFTIVSPVMLAAVFTVTMAALYGMGMMGASVFLLLGREAWHFANLVQEPVHFLSGVYFPVRSLGYPIALAASIIPMTLGLDAMRQLMFTNGSSFALLSVNLELAILVVLGAGFITASVYLMQYMERLAIKDGKITEMRS
jgi:ABC-2 type transport system permease protein